LVVEGNILLKATDMDINLGRSQQVDDIFTWYEWPIVNHLARELPNLGAIFDIAYLEDRWLRRLATHGANRVIVRVRDHYMREIYQAATVNLSHIASSIILREVEQGRGAIAAPNFRRALYLAIKYLQGHDEIRLHRGLCDPDRYQAVLDSAPSALSEFLDSAAGVGLISHDDDQIVFHDKLAEQHEFDAIRLENPIEVYANEVEPLAPVASAVERAVAQADDLAPAALARELFDDELKALAWDRALYGKAKHAEINARETATADPSPFLLVPDERRRIGVVLTHGFLASPAEVRAFGDKLAAAGYLTVGVRLKGHGTSPWDLRERSWKDWQHAVERGRRIIEGFVDDYALVGFSTGGNLSLVSACENPARVAGVSAICAPIKFRNRNMRFVPLMHGANRVVRWLSSYEGVMPFRPNDSEHPHINYRHMPLRGLYELTRLAAHATRLLPELERPTCVVQADADHVVDPQSASIIYDRVAAHWKELHWVESERHGILNEDVGHTHERVLTFLERLDAGAIVHRPNIARLDGDGIVFEDGTRERADVLVCCTGYDIVFPFFDEDFVSAPGNDLPLFMRVVHPDHPTLFFVGLVQPLGAIMPIADAQSRWIADALRGRYALPDASEITLSIDEERRAMLARYVASPRHTIQVDFDDYLVALERERRRGAARAAREGFVPVDRR
ncbi:MAG: alpha/beta hydrolase, partial [Myxococcales bacterium]|nr:alpha/beta hydrolase [Myxococcales bacterium]